jgi:DNA-binding MarR family transcriptional regulator
MKLKKAERRFHLATRDYARLAAMRLALRKFLRFSERAATRAGLTSQHYQAMLVLRGCPEDRRVTIADLAEQLLIKHNSAVELVDRLVAENLVIRKASSADRRKVELRLTGHGREVLAKLAAVHRAELQRIGPVLKRFFAELSRPPTTAGRKKRRASPSSAGA